MPTATRKPPAKKPAPDPLRLLRQATSPVERLQSDVYAQQRKVQQAEQKLAEERRQLSFLEGKAGRIAALISNGGALAREADAKPFDAALRSLCRKCKQAPWVKLQRAGASDEQIATVLKTGWPSYAGYGRTRAEGGEYSDRPHVFIDNPNGTPTLKGKHLIAEVRRVMGIPQPKPKAAPKPPTPAKKTAAAPAANTVTVATSAKKKPAAKKGGKGGAGGSGAAAKASAAVASKPAAADDDADDEDLDAAAGGGTVDEIEGGETYTTRQLGIIDPAALERSMPPAEKGGLCGNSPDDKRGGYIGQPLTLSDGFAWAVVGASERSGRTVYALQPLNEVRQPSDYPLEWAARRKKLPSVAPEDVPLSGLVVERPDGRKLQLGLDSERIYCVVPHEARPAPAKKGAAAAAGDDTADVVIPTIPPHVGKMTLKLWRGGVLREWHCGADVDLSPGNLGRKVIGPLSRPGFPDRAAAIADTARHLLDEASWLVRSLPKSKVVNGRAVVAALREFGEGLGQPNGTFAAVAADPEAAPLGTPAWAKAMGFGDDVSPDRAKTIAALPADRRHLMKDARVTDVGEYVAGLNPEVEWTSCAAGELTIFLSRDGDGRWHAGHDLFFRRASIGSDRRFPRVDGPMYEDRGEAVQEELSRVLKTIDEKKGPPFTKADEEAARAMAKHLRDWGREQAKRAAQAVADLAAKAPPPAKSKPKSNGRGGAPLHPVAAAVLATGGPLVTGAPAAGLPN